MKAIACHDSLNGLASSIFNKASELSDLLSANGIPSPSFREESYGDFADGTDRHIDYQLRRARNELISSAQEIVRLAQGPTDQILNLGWSAIDGANLGVIVRFEIPQNIPLRTNISSQDLAAKTGLPEDILARTIRYAVNNGLFCEPSPGYFAHTAASAILARNEHIRNIALFSTHEIAAIITRLPDGLKLQHENKHSGPSATFSLAYPSYEDPFELFSQNTAAGDRYHTYLHGRVNTPRWSVHHFVNAWDWAAIGSGTIVDVGGSTGHTCRALVPVCPDAKFIVQDNNDEAMVLGRHALDSDPALQSRITFAKHDFFTPQPTTADVYVFRHIIHDWSDEDSIRILKALVPGLKDGARILISEGIVPEPPAIRSNVLDGKQIRVEDAIMMAVHYARERTVAEYVDLFGHASANYHFVGATGGEDGAFQSLLEFIYKE